jgi:hypothetical protein
LERSIRIGPLAFGFSLYVTSSLPIPSRNSSHNDKLKNTTKDFFFFIFKEIEVLNLFFKALRKKGVKPQSEKPSERDEPERRLEGQ